LALELEDSVLIIDDKRGRKLAREQNIELTGTLGTLLKAKNMGVIPRIRPLVDKLEAKNYRISTDIIEGILKRAGE
jgi:predicted nucleic acid-binding protein